jgi:hypothetical protein
LLAALELVAACNEGPNVNCGGEKNNFHSGQILRQDQQVVAVDREPHRVNGANELAAGMFLFLESLKLNFLYRYQIR